MSKLAPSPSARNARKLTALTPTEFENLLYDICVSRGMINVAWRTPGADGGRDIEATSIERDAAGFQVVHKWFIECKRYTGSVDWPTIYQKLAHADALQADRLLICAASKFTPTAITQVDNWNNSRRGVLIRLWPSHEIEMQLKMHPDLLVKYGLSNAPAAPGKSVVALSLALSKAVSSSYSEVIFQDAKPSYMLQASQALAELLLKRMEDLSVSGSIRKIYVNKPVNSLEGVEFIGDFSRIDEVGIRAFAAYLRALLKSELKVTCSGSSRCLIDSPVDATKILSRYRDTFDSIAIWSDAEYSVNQLNIEVRQRQ